MFQKPLMCLIGMLLVLFGIAIGKIMNASADEINYEYQSNNIGYDSTDNNLNATNVKDAIDELYGKVGQCPTGQFCYSSDEIRNISGGNILRAYTYDETENSSTFCLTGEEESCITNTCYNNLDSGSCASGTIIDYFVNNSIVVRFHVLHDNGDTITMQSQKNTLYNIAWYSEEDNHTEGPQTIMTELNRVTNGWSNVKDITLADGMTQFSDGTSANNNCTGILCDPYTSGSNGYPYSKLVNNASIGSSVKSRMITITETAALGCTTSYESCPIYLYNYLQDSISYCRVSGKCTSDTYKENGASTNQGYWTMSGVFASDTSRAWGLNGIGHVLDPTTMNITYGARAVVVVNK